MPTYGHISTFHQKEQYYRPEVQFLDTGRPFIVTTPSTFPVMVVWYECVSSGNPYKKN